ncbi:MAG TPA: site-specific integrase, partial [Ktedonobacteraceae bacterium]|nr:site-specific integrase [Ktedonobacteraceae bacterium]
LSVSGLEQIITQLGERAHITGVRCSPHTLRHTWAVRYLLNGGDLYKLSRLMGHTSVKITERYVASMRAWQARQGGQSVLDHLKDS